MPPPLSHNEQRLRSFCRILAALSFAAAALAAFAPSFSYRLLSGDAASVSPESSFWNALAAAVAIAIGVSCVVVARDPRTMRSALLPVLAAELTASSIAFFHLGSGRALSLLFLAGVPLFVVTLVLYRAASPGVKGPPAVVEHQEGAGQPAAPVPLGVPK